MLFLILNCPTVHSDESLWAIALKTLLSNMLRNTYTVHDINCYTLMFNRILLKPKVSKYNSTRQPTGCPTPTKLLQALCVCVWIPPLFKGDLSAPWVISIGHGLTHPIHIHPSRAIMADSLSIPDVPSVCATGSVCVCVCVGPAKGPHCPKPGWTSPSYKHERQTREAAICPAELFAVEGPSWTPVNQTVVHTPTDPTHCPWH